jgi:hypothetical protein
MYSKIIWSKYIVALDIYRSYWFECWKDFLITYTKNQTPYHITYYTMTHRRSCFINRDKSKNHLRLRSLNSPRHFLQLMMRIMYFIFKLRGSPQSPYGIYHAQTNIDLSRKLTYVENVWKLFTWCCNRKNMSIKLS